MGSRFPRAGVSPLLTAPGLNNSCCLHRVPLPTCSAGAPVPCRPTPACALRLYSADLDFQNLLDMPVLQKAAYFNIHDVLTVSLCIFSISASLFLSLFVSLPLSLCLSVSLSFPSSTNNMSGQSVPSQRDHQATSSNISTHVTRLPGLGT